MAGGGGKGGSTSTEVSIPAWLEQAAQSGLARGEQAAGIGYVPYRGPDVAALTPMQEAAMANTSAASSAFGLGASPLPGAGMPAVQTFADGTRGYSSAPLYDQAVNELKMRDPAQYAKLMAPFSGGGQFGITSMPMGGVAQSYGQPLREGRQKLASTAILWVSRPASCPPRRLQRSSNTRVCPRSSAARRSSPACRARSARARTCRATRPTSSAAIRAPRTEPMPPMTTTTKQMISTLLPMPG